jgi:hypothetical protein
MLFAPLERLFAAPHRLFNPACQARMVPGQQAVVSGSPDSAIGSEIDGWERL